MHIQYVYEQADDFLNKGITQEQIPGYIISALENGEIIGYQGRGNGRPIYEFIDIVGNVDDVVRLLTDYGDNADEVLTAVNSYGTEAVDLITNYGDEAVELFKDGKSPFEVAKNITGNTPIEIEINGEEIVIYDLNEVWELNPTFRGKVVEKILASSEYSGW